MLVKKAEAFALASNDKKIMPFEIGVLVSKVVLLARMLSVAAFTVVRTDIGAILQETTHLSAKLCGDVTRRQPFYSNAPRNLMLQLIGPDILTRWRCPDGKTPNFIYRHSGLLLVIGGVNTIQGSSRDRGPRIGYEL